MSGPDNDGDGLVVVVANSREIIARCNYCDLLQSVSWHAARPTEGKE